MTLYICKKNFVQLIDEEQVHPCYFCILIDNLIDVQYIVQTMEAVSYSDLRKNLKNYLDHVYQDHDPLIVTRKNNENVVLISMDEYNSLIETNYLMANEANAKHLMKSINQANKKKLKPKNLIEE